MTETLPDGRRLILASTSPFRHELLTRLQLPFVAIAPIADETPQSDESPQQLVVRLAKAKAHSVAAAQRHAVVIGSDQVAVLHGSIFGKPGTHQNARQQLGAASGNTMVFYTSLALIDSDSGRTQVEMAPFRVHFRSLSQVQIERYLQREQPYQCAGSFKSEGLGITLCDKFDGEDPSSLVGLPLIRLTRMLEREGIPVP